MAIKIWPLGRVHFAGSVGRSPPTAGLSDPRRRLDRVCQEPDKPKELLITPDKSQTAGSVAFELDEASSRTETARTHPRHAGMRRPISHICRAWSRRSYFDEILLIVPRTTWWMNRRNREEIEAIRRPKPA